MIVHIWNTGIYIQTTLLKKMFDSYYLYIVHLKGSEIDQVIAHICKRKEVSFLC